MTATVGFMIPQAEACLLPFGGFQILHLKADLHHLGILGIILQMAVAVYIGSDGQGLGNRILRLGIELQVAGKGIHEALGHIVGTGGIIIFNKLPTGATVQIDPCVLGIILIPLPGGGIVVKINKQGFCSRVAAAIRNVNRNSTQFQILSAMVSVFDHHGIVPRSAAGKAAGKLKTVGTCIGVTASRSVIEDLALTGEGLEAVIDPYICR